MYIWYQILFYLSDWICKQWIGHTFSEEASRMVFFWDWSNESLPDDCTTGIKLTEQWHITEMLINKLIHQRSQENRQFGYK